MDHPFVDKVICNLNRCIPLIASEMCFFMCAVAIFVALMVSLFHIWPTRSTHKT